MTKELRSFIMTLEVTFLFLIHSNVFVPLASPYHLMLCFTILYLLCDKLGFCLFTAITFFFNVAFVVIYYFVCSYRVEELLDICNVIYALMDHYLIWCVLYCFIFVLKNIIQENSYKIRICRIMYGCQNKIEKQITIYNILPCCNS
jgi:hypothetical protein